MEKLSLLWIICRFILWNILQCAIVSIANIIIWANMFRKRFNLSNPKWHCYSFMNIWLFLNFVQINIRNGFIHHGKTNNSVEVYELNWTEWTLVSFYHLCLVLYINNLQWKLNRKLWFDEVFSLNIWFRLNYAVDFRFSWIMSIKLIAFITAENFCSDP